MYLSRMSHFESLYALFFYPYSGPGGLLHNIRSEVFVLKSFSKRLCTPTTDKSCRARKLKCPCLALTTIPYILNYIHNDRADMYKSSSCQVVNPLLNGDET